MRQLLHFVVLGMLGVSSTAMGQSSVPLAPSGLVELRSVGKQTQVSQVVSGGAPFFLCETPCALSLPVGPIQLSASGPGQRTVGFGIMVLPGAGVDVRIRPGSNAKFASGVGLTAGGLVGIGLGIVALTIGGITLSGAGDKGFLNFVTDGFVGSVLVGTGAVLGAAGIALVIPGAILWAHSEGAAQIGPLRRQLSFVPLSFRAHF